MPQSLANVRLRIAFSTKNRAPFLQSPKVREEMEAYMVGTLVAIECPSLIVLSKTTCIVYVSFRARNQSRSSSKK